MSLPSPEKLWVYHEAVDLRKSYLGLCKILEQDLKRESKSGEGFVFVNRNKRLAKVLWWDRTGWCLFLKKLSASRFRVSGNQEIISLELSKVRFFFDGM
jgi:transposase